VGTSEQDDHGFVRVIGHVNMEQISIDLTDLCSPRKRQLPQIGVGTEVELIGTDPRAPNHVPTLAGVAGTVPHQLLCSLNPRIKRMYHARESYQRSAVSVQQAKAAGGQLVAGK
jgi:alanine racemase